VGKISSKTVTVKMPIERCVTEQAGAGAIRRQRRQPIPIDVETVVVERVDGLVKDVTFINVIAVGQARSNRHDPKQGRHEKNDSPTNPVEEPCLLRRSAKVRSRFEQELQQTDFSAEEKEHFVRAGACAFL